MFDGAFQNLLLFAHSIIGPLKCSMISHRFPMDSRTLIFEIFRIFGYPGYGDDTVLSDTIGAGTLSMALLRERRRFVRLAPFQFFDGRI